MKRKCLSISSMRSERSERSIALAYQFSSSRKAGHHLSMEPMDKKNPSSHILGLDFGEKRIGMAIGDEKTKMVFPRDTLRMKNQRLVFDYLNRLCKEEGIMKIVIGLPLGDDDGETKVSEKIRKFKKGLDAALGIPVVFQEESFSTKEALWKMPKEKKEHRDTLAAMIILERYLGTC